MKTERETLEACRDLWALLAETGSDDKGSALADLDMPEMMHSCPCCQYLENRGIGTGCVSPCAEDCPLQSLWPDGCLKEDSPYSRWVNAVERPGAYKSLEVRKEMAAQIRDECTALLEEDDED